MDPAKLLRLSTVCLWGALLCLPVVIYWAARVRLGTVVVQSWLPGEDAARTAYSEFVARFGDDQVLFLSWPGCRLDDSRLARVASVLRELQRQSPELGIAAVNDSASMLAAAADADRGLSAEAARQRLAGIAIGADGSCFIALQLSEATQGARGQLIQRVMSLASSQTGVPEEQLILAGEPFQVYIIDRASRETMQYYVAPSSCLALLVAWLCLGSWRLTLRVFVLAGCGQLIALALIAWFLGEMSAVMVVMPTLVFMLTLSAAVHLTNYYRESGGLGDPRAGARALLLGARPCLVATLTTVCGFGSLIVSNLQPVWQFGWLSSLGLLFSTLVLLGVFPAVMALGSRDGRSPAAAELPHASDRLAAALATFTARWSTAITALGIAALIGAGWGITRLQSSTEFEDMFPKSSPAVSGLRWIEAHVGPIDTLEFVLSFDRPSRTTEPAEFDRQLLDRLQLLARVHDALERSVHTASVMSAISFLPAIPDGAGTRDTIRRAVLRRSINAHLDRLHAQHLVADLPGAQQWRLSARIHQLCGTNYAPIYRALQSAAEQSLAGQPEKPLADLSPVGFSQAATPGNRPQLSITGLQVVMERAHSALLSDLGSSFVAAFALIAPLMMLIVGSIRGGLILMLPNVLPVALVFGSMGWLQIKLDVASILTASVALGIAVDDTLHFVTWFLRQRRAGCPVDSAVREAISRCGRPMLHTTLICAGSMLPFFLSDFLPTSKFALLMILILAGAILGDLLLLPALLQARWQRFVSA